jgi:hypothetical protein
LVEEVGVLAMACQYSSTLGLPVPRQRIRSGQDSHEAAAFHILLEKRHSKRRCRAVSGQHLQSWQVVGCVQPLLARRSAVHRRFWTASQAKKRHFGGAQVYQTMLPKGQGKAAMN